MKVLLAICLLGPAAVLGLFSPATFQRTTTAPLPASLAGTGITINATVREPSKRSPPIGKDFYIAAPTIDAKAAATVAYHSSSDCPTWSTPTIRTLRLGTCLSSQAGWTTGDKRVTCAQPGNAASAWTLETWLGSVNCQGSTYRTATGTGTGCVNGDAGGSVTVNCAGVGGSTEFPATLRLNATTAEGSISSGGIGAVATGPDGSTKYADCSPDPDFGPDAFKCTFTFYSWDRPGSYRVTEVSIRNSWGTTTTYSGSQLPASLAFTLLANVDTTPPRISNVHVTAQGSDKNEVTINEGTSTRWHSAVRLSFKATDDMSGVQSISAVFTINYGGRDYPRVIHLDADSRRIAPGSRHDGEYQYDFSNLFLIPGRWMLRALHVTDFAGNVGTITLADVLARKGRAVVEAKGPPLRFPKRASLVAAGITPYIDIRVWSESIYYNMTLEGPFNTTTDIHAECNYRNGDELFVTSLNFATRSTDANGNTVLRYSRFMWSSDGYLPGPYRLIGCIIETREFDVVETSVYGELTEDQKYHLEQFVYRSAAPALAASLPFLGLLAAIAAALAAAF